MCLDRIPTDFSYDGVASNDIGPIVNQHKPKTIDCYCLQLDP